MAIDEAKLKKIMALMDSPFEGERIAAMNKANKILADNGITWRDYTSTLMASSQDTARSNGQADDTAVKARQAAAAEHARKSAREREAREREAREQEERKREAMKCAARERAERKRAAAKRTDEERLRDAAILEMEEKKLAAQLAALEPTPMERAIDAAAAPFMRNKMFNRDGKRTRLATVDGWNSSDDPIPERAGAAVRAALPLPTTIAEAKAEIDVWRERESRLKAVFNFSDHTLLSPGCRLREHIVTVMCADLEHLAQMQTASARHESAPTPTAPVKNGHQTATDRRNEVIRLLSDPITAALSDREIARRVGCSHQTACNIRRRVGAEATAAA